MAETFCIIPFKQLIVRSDGHPQVCNRIADRLTDQGSPLSVGQQPLRAIWNCDGMRTMRRAMVEGRSVYACEECYRAEESGAVSLRQEMNRRWRAGFLNDGNETTETIAFAARENDYSLTAGPSFLQLDVGSLCNLKCRMCNSGASSRINADPVHRAWTGPALDGRSDPDVWFRQRSVVEEVFRHAAELQQVHIIGGEPFLIEEIGTVLQTLIAAGVARDIELSFHTNATRTRAAWLDMLTAFRAVVMYVSVDGASDDYEYIRYPARWSSFCSNIRELASLPNTELRAHVVVQNYNALHLVDLFVYLDDQQIPFFPHLLDTPEYLRATTMPRPARQLAAERFRAYAGQALQPDVRDIVLGIASHLEADAAEVSEALLREFMVFTNDLDRTRGQNFREVHGDLCEFIQESGLTWTDDTRHVRLIPVSAT